MHENQNNMLLIDLYFTFTVQLSMPRWTFWCHPPDVFTACNMEMFSQKKQTTVNLIVVILFFQL